jgi:Tol biopolymer transport system component
MGEVWRARDTSLGRDVALKLLPGDFAEDPERHGRFEREAKVLAALNHPNIATLYGLEHLQIADGYTVSDSGSRTPDPNVERAPRALHVLVMEVVEGEGLDERIARGAIPAHEAVPLALQIARALEAAHEKGIVHRDLKPANVKVRPDGTVKVLDFGLAKAWAEEGSVESSLSVSPTITSRRTRAGAILGTVAYMAPEQAKGKAVDKRADIWALGVVLWELLTGSRPFVGETGSDVLASVLLREPDWHEAARQFGPELARVLSGCLAKDPRQRFGSARDVGLMLERAVQADAAAGAAAGGRRLSVPLAAAVAVAGIAIGAGVVWTVRPTAPGHGTVRLSVVDPDIVASSGVAISPEGRRLALVLGQDQGNVLAIRSLDSFDTVAIPGTEGAVSPFFSPDGEWLGYFTRTELRKVPVSGGSHRTIARFAGRVRFDPWSAGSYPTADWGSDDVIVFSSGFWREPSTGTGLFTVPGTGGEPKPLTALNGTELGHRLPHFSPDGRSVIFTAQGRGPRNQHVDAVERASGTRRRLQNEVTNGQVVASGYLVATDSFSSRLVAAPIDTASLEPAGPAVPLIEGVGTAAAQNYALGRDGTLAYFAAGAGEGESRLVRVDLDGAVSTLADRAGSWYQPRTSPDGRHLVVREVADECRLWLLDLDRRTLMPLTGSGDSHQPVWARSGREVAYGHEDLGRGLRGLFRKSIGGGRGLEALLASESGRASRSLSVPYPDSFSPGDRELLFEQSALETGSDLWVLNTESGTATPLIATPAFEGDGAFSPDGRWVAYVSDESGRQEVYVRAYPGEGRRLQVSTAGGEWPIWSRDGRRLYYSQLRRLMAVDFDGEGNEPVVGRPQEVLRGFAFGRGNLDLLQDGRSFVLVQPAAPGVTELRIVTNWTRALQDAVPGGRRP